MALTPSLVFYLLYTYNMSKTALTTVRLWAAESTTAWVGWGNHSVWGV